MRKDWVFVSVALIIVTVIGAIYLANDNGGGALLSPLLAIPAFAAIIAGVIGFGSASDPHQQASKGSMVTIYGLGAVLTLSAAIMNCFLGDWYLALFMGAVFLGCVGAAVWSIRKT